MKHLSAIVLSIIVGAGLADAQQTYTLEECRQMALANNAKMVKAERDVASAKAQRQEAFTHYFPEISASGMAMTTNKPVISLDILNMVTLDLIRHGVGAGVTAVQPVFAGGQIVNSNKLAAVGEAVSQLRRQQSANEVVLTTEKYFWKMVTLQSTRLTLTDAIAMLDTMSAQVQVAVDAGVVTNNDLLKVRLKRNEYEASMVDLENGIALCRMVLGQYIGLELTDQFEVSATVPQTVPDIPTELYVAADNALSSTVEYQLLEKQVSAASLQKKIEVGKHMPTVGVGAGYFYQNLIRKGGNGFGALFVSVNVPLSDWWGGSYAIKRKNLALENARTDLADLSQMLQINMQNKWNDLTAAHRKMQIAAESIDQSAENLRMNRNFYEAGTTTITNLLDAQTLYTQSCTGYTTAYGNYRTALAEYLAATGR
jgi:outer membrane protein TolC